MSEPEVTYTRMTARAESPRCDNGQLRKLAFETSQTTMQFYLSARVALVALTLVFFSPVVALQRSNAQAPNRVPGITLSPPPPQEGAEPLTPIEPESEELRQACEAFQEHIKKVWEIQIRFDVGTSLEEDKWREQFNAIYPEGVKLFNDMVLAGAKEYDSDPNNKPEFKEWLTRIVNRQIESDKFEGLLPVIEVLLKHCSGQDLAEMHTNMGLTSYALCEFERGDPSIEYLMEQPNAPLDILESTKKRIDVSKENWKEELAARKADAEGEPLPRVLIRTTKGEIEVELFENQAPETVANFIYLAENGIYEDQPFGFGKQHLLIQGGGDDIVSPPYSIYGEADKPGARKFFRGTLGLALAGHPDSGYSQFFFALAPSPDVLDGQYTAFGRVVKGIEVMANLAIIDPEESEKDKNGPKNEPDEIIEVEVLQKRDHEYLPNKVK